MNNILGECLALVSQARMGMLLTNIKNNTRTTDEEIIKEKEKNKVVIES